MKILDRIHEFLRFGSVLGLDRMYALLERIGDPHRSLRVLHVAGTNGKGSICRYLYEMLQAGGYRTGLYVSPYLEVFHERIVFDGAQISDADLERCGARVVQAAEDMVACGLESPTEFEVVTAIALLYFQEQQADYVVLEVGLGGRGDSTNVVAQPLCSIIASISLDHTDRLGETIAEIAGEKAGIIKAGCPVITGTDRPEAMAVFRERAAALHAPLYDSCTLPRKVLAETETGCRFETEILGHPYTIELSMAGEHQIRNALEALYAVTVLRQRGVLALTDAAICAGCARARQIGRFEILRRGPWLILDGAHNPDGAVALRETVQRRFAGKKILMVVGILADKEVPQVLDQFLQITCHFIATAPENPRRLPAAALAEAIAARGGQCLRAADTPAEAVAAALAEARQGGWDVILFAGSLYLIGAVRSLLRTELGETDTADTE